jgi:hypothetical protein
MDESTIAPPAAPEAPPAVAPTPAEPARLNYVQHLIVGIAMGVVALFTAFAWVPAMLTGSVIGQERVERSKGIRARPSLMILRVLAVTGGFLVMLFAGAIIGGIIALLIVALASFSERLAADASPNDRTIARILIGLVTIVVWFGALYILQINLNIKVGS